MKFRKTKVTKYPKNIRKRKIINNKKPFLIKKFFYLGSPFNTNDFLIDNNSSPFWIGEEDEDSITIAPSSPIYFFDDSNSEMNLFTKKLESTKEITNITSDNKAQKNQIFLIGR